MACVALVALAACSFSGCATTALSTQSLSPEQRAEEHGRRFDHVEQVVRTRYYAPDLHGVDWDELCERYRPQAVAAADEGAWYRTVNGMLHELRDAHTRAERPRLVRPELSRTLAPDAAALRDGGVTVVLADGTVVLRFDHFDSSTVRWLARQIEIHQEAPALIVDLRDNRGGLVTANQRAVGLFFPEPVTIGTVVRRNGRRITERSVAPRGPEYDGPMAVLIGPDTYSSAEVFARVMQYHERAVVVGLPTAGKVLGARPFRLRDGGRLFVSTTDFFGCDGRRLEATGVKPDVSVIGMTPLGDPATDPGVIEAQLRLAALRLGPTSE